MSFRGPGRPEDLAPACAILIVTVHPAPMAVPTPARAVGTDGERAGCEGTVDPTSLTEPQLGDDSDVWDVLSLFGDVGGRR